MMSEPSPIVSPVRADSSAHVSTMRHAAIGMAALALVILVGWYAANGGDTQTQMAASMERHGELQRQLFREDKSGIYVALPPNASFVESSLRARALAQAALAPKDSPPNAAPPIVATLSAAEAKPVRAKTNPETPADATAALQGQDATTSDEPTSTAPDEPATEAEEPTAAASTLDAPYKPKADEPARIKSRPDEPISAAETVDDATPDEPRPGQPMADEPTWNEPPPADDDDEPTPDEPDEMDEPA